MKITVLNNLSISAHSTVYTGEAVSGSHTGTIITPSLQMSSRRFAVA